MTDGKNFFNKPVKNESITNENIRKIATSQGYESTIGCLLDCIYFKNYYKMIEINLSKQQVLDGDPKTIQQINFTGNLDRGGNTTIFFITEEAEENILDFYKDL